MAKKDIIKENVVLGNLEVSYVGVNEIKPNTYNPNRQSEHEFELLCRSMEEDGFTTPCVVRKVDMMIVDGEHRWRAAQSIGMEEVPVVFVDMTDAQMKISTLRHNRARGEEDSQLASAVLRDLAAMGDIGSAQDSLMLDDVEMSKLLNEIQDPETLIGEEYKEQYEILKDENGNVLSREKVNLGSWAASDAVRAQEEALKKARTDEERVKYQTDVMNIFRFNFSFHGDEAAKINEVIGAAPAQRILKICKMEFEKSAAVSG